MPHHHYALAHPRAVGQNRLHFAQFDPVHVVLTADYVKNLGFNRAEIRNRTGKVITDPLAVEIAGHYLKTALESGEGLGREMYSLTVAETLRHIDELRQEIESRAIPANGSGS